MQKKLKMQKFPLALLLVILIIIIPSLGLCPSDFGIFSCKLNRRIKNTVKFAGHSCMRPPNVFYYFQRECIFFLRMSDNLQTDDDGSYKLDMSSANDLSFKRRTPGIVRKQERSTLHDRRLQLRTFRRDDPPESTPRLLQNISVVLLSTKRPVTIGMVARACACFEVKLHPELEFITFIQFICD
jgi:hypothetical protein